MAEATEALSSPTQAEQSIEQRIQTQFNEEKWTRISAKDVSISRFKILDGLIEEAQKQNKLEYLRQVSIEHLQEYEPSVSARYFLGMVALLQNNPDEGIYLKQLLDQFQDHAKWAVVDVLTEKMLSYTDNRTILRARATALEKLGKTKEAIPVLEKLARSDRKNPDIALKLADAIINDDIEKGITFYKQAAEAYAKSLQLDKLKVVWGKLIDLVPDDFAFYKRIERILASQRVKESIAELYQSLAMYYIKKDDLDRIIELSKKILEYNPNFVRFKNELIRAYREKYKNHSLINEFLEMSGLLKGSRNILNAIQNFETYMVFDKGNYVFHRNWGVGKIVDISPGQMVIDFKDKPAHSMQLQMALRSLKPLKENHFWVLQYEKPQQLQELFEKDLPAFFRILLSSFGNRMSLSDIKAELSRQFVPQDQWSKWWAKVRQEILQDPHIGLSTQKKDELELRETPVTNADVILERFHAAQNFDDKSEILLEALKDKDLGVGDDTIDLMAVFFVDSLKSFDFSVKIRSLLLLDMIVEQTGEEASDTSDARGDIIQELRGMSVQQLAELGSSISNPELKKNFARFVKQNHPEWKKVFLEMLFERPVKIHRHLFADLQNAAAHDELREFFQRLRKDAKEHAEVFLWITRQLLTTQLSLEAEVIKEHILAFFRLLRLLPKIEPKGTKLKNQAKEILFSFLSQSKLESIGKLIERYALESLRKIASLFSDVGFLSDIEKVQFMNFLRELSPRAFDEELEEKVGEEVVSLASRAEKSGRTLATAAAVERLRKELEHILTVEIPKNSEDIGLAQEKGDLRENAEYKAALEQQAILQATVAKLENDLKNIDLLQRDKVSTDKVDVGTKVRLRDVESGDIFTYVVLDQWDADVDRGIISYKSPLGRALLEKKRGDIAHFQVGEKLQKLEILSIEHALDEQGNLA
ncbi:MAG: transcription elongation factor GreA [Leptospiraceae bacterium]|nr:transcription elongation factor GreA [Leptospiraceae bacterium]MDW8305449.1 transcription elongation factor GreA [Leptospiraceae bacterium]